MSDNKEKEFSISQVFDDPRSWKIGADYWREDFEEHFGAKWKIGMRKVSDGYLRPYLFCESSQTGNWSINTVYDLLVGGLLVKARLQWKFNNKKRSLISSFSIPESYFSKYGIVESVTIEYRVKIIEMTGIREKSINSEDGVVRKSSEVEESKKPMKFDDDVAKESSDVVLKVGDQKFYVSKLYLSFHSTYFKTLFSGNFSESQKSELELKDIDPYVFQYFLELIYGISAVDDTMIMEILKLADFFDAKTVIERCQEFLLNRSEQPLKIKFQAALKYKMEKLKVKCYSEMRKGTDFQGLLPENEDDYSKKDYLELLQKVVSFL